MKIGEYEIYIDGKKRYYYEDLSKRDYNLENTRPFLLSIDGYELSESSWVELIRNLSAYLIGIKPDYKNNILNFKVDWTKAKIFTKNKIVNSKMIDKNLYVNCNHTALHSCWLVQDLLKYFEIDLKKVKFLIFRPSGAEPEEVKEKIIEKRKEEFSLYLEISESLNEDEIEMVIYNIENEINEILRQISNSYDNFFLFDDFVMAYNYSERCLKILNNSLEYDYESKEILRYCLKCIINFYKI